MQPSPRKPASNAWYLLLAIPFLGLLLPLYVHAEPMLAGFPFFYWYQLLWIPISAGLTWIVYLRTQGESEG